MSAESLSAAGLTVIGASAGSGKTFRLTEIVERAVVGQGQDAVLPEGLVAVTYTRRAHVELESRIRQKLLQSETPERAHRLPLAYVGTVHAVCLRWLRELAIDAGVSPEVDVLTDADAIVQVLEEAVPADQRDELDRLARALQTHKDQREDLVHWSMPVGEIVELARHGRIAPSELSEMAARSTASFECLFATPPAPNGAVLDDRLASEVDAAIAALEAGGDTTKTTEEARVRLKQAQAELRYGRLPWGEWVALSGLKVGAKARAAVAGLQAAAMDYERHPDLRRECAQLIRLVFAAAASALTRYEAWKKERALVDYVDMIDAALTVLHDDEVAAEMRRRLQLVVVDEVQDSSPIQLALFLRLHRLANQSAWVGDPKQCIFEYAGADPALMDAVLAWSRRSGGAAERLETNYRSRPELVELTSELFATALSRQGFAREDVVATAKRETPAALSSLPPVGLFYLESGKNEEDAWAIAAGVARILAGPESTPVLDRFTREARPVRPGDIAVLVHTNLEAEAIATALSAHRVRATLARTGLMQTPEGRVLAAALHYVLDDRDAGALAELEAVHGFGEGGPDAWLTAKLLARLDDKPAEEPIPAWQSRLDALRKRSSLLSPLELVDATIVALDLSALAARWPDAPQRLANLDALRKFAKVYESRCIDDAEGASLAGLLRFLSHLTEAKYRQSEERAADEQHAGADDGAVTVMTYHKSKGLEWPVVVMASLDRAPRDKLAFKVTPETDATELDPDDPLKGRWIRYWPWPFGPGRKAPLEKAAAESPEGIAAVERNRRERARLLYVGLTRARDHVVLAARLKKGAPETAWVDELAAAEGTPALSWPSSDAPDPTVTIRRDDGASLVVPARIWIVAPDEPERAPDSTERVWFSRPAQLVERPDYVVRPSDGEASNLVVSPLAITTVHTIHEPVVSEAKGELAWNTIGDAIHAFLAADVEGLTPDERRDRATRLLQVQGVLGTYSPIDVIAAADAFRAFVDRELPGARWRREVPIEARVPTEQGERKIDGRIDLLLETDEACVIVDHKSFAGAGEAAWRARAATYAGQLAVYAHAIGRVAGAKPLRECWVHFTVGGGVVRLGAPNTHEG